MLTQAIKLADRRQPIAGFRPPAGEAGTRAVRSWVRAKRFALVAGQRGKMQVQRGTGGAARTLVGQRAGGKAAARCTGIPCSMCCTTSSVDAPRTAYWPAQACRNVRMREAVGAIVLARAVPAGAPTPCDRD